MWISRQTSSVCSQSLPRIGSKGKSSIDRDESVIEIDKVTLLHSERPKLYAILAFLSAIGLAQILSARTTMAKLSNKTKILQTKNKYIIQKKELLFLRDK